MTSTDSIEHVEVTTNDPAGVFSLLEKKILSYNGSSVEVMPIAKQDSAGLAYIESFVRGGRLTRICVACFSRDFKIRESRYDGAGLAKRTACRHHQNQKQKETRTKRTKENGKKGSDVKPKFIPTADYEKIREIIRTFSIKKILLFDIDEGGKVEFDQEGYPIQRYSTGKEFRLCSACICFESVLRKSANTHYLCHRHLEQANAQEKGKEWPSSGEVITNAQVVSQMLALAVPLDACYVQFGEKPPATRPVSKYTMCVKRRIKIERRFEESKAPKLMDSQGVLMTPFLSSSGELRGWTGADKVRLCEECYSRRNVIRKSHGVARKCLSHINKTM